MAYIKSYSNYVLKSKHQVTNDGTIYERDYTTIGGLGNYTKNQTPIYQTGNFIMTVNNEKVNAKILSNEKWEENANGEIWTYSNVENISSNTEFKDNKIVLKEDFHSLLDFAYFGSCTELVRTSITDALNKFPGELFATDITYDNDTEKI